MVIHIDTQLKTVFGLYDDEAKLKGITTAPWCFASKRDWMRKKPT